MYHFAAFGDEYELIRFWGQKFKSKGRDETKYGQKRRKYIYIDSSLSSFTFSVTFKRVQQ